MSDQLIVEGIELVFGGVRALEGVSRAVGNGELVAIIGPNGAGKSSLLNTISGLYAPRRGRIQFEGTSILGRTPHHIARMGIARTFQNLGVFANLTVLDNLLLGRHLHVRCGLLAGGMYWPWARREEAEHRHAVEPIINMLGLQTVTQRPVGSLSYGIQKRVELGRAIAQQPRLLLLDEPMAGMNRHEKEEMARCIVRFRSQSAVAVVMIEHDMGVVMDVSQRIVVLDFGRCIATGRPQDIVRDPRVIRAYLGADERGHADGLLDIA